MQVPTFSQTEMARVHAGPSRSSRSTGRSNRLGGILFLALLLPCAPASSVTTAPATQSVTLLWNGNPSSDQVAGYRVYFGTASGSYSDSVVAGNVTSRTMTGLTNGVPYFFAITAYDGEGLESAFSAEVSYRPMVPDRPRIQTRVMPGGQIILSVQGTSGRFFFVEASEDLIGWTAIDVVLLPSAAALELTDPDATNFMRRFYRMRELFL